MSQKKETQLPQQPAEQEKSPGGSESSDDFSDIGEVEEKKRATLKKWKQTGQPQGQ